MNSERSEWSIVHEHLHSGIAPNVEAFELQQAQDGFHFELRVFRRVPIENKAAANDLK